ncbi:hypothetical protein DFH09DRAFT_1171813, partial [Mycena vulgaris]
RAVSTLNPSLITLADHLDLSQSGMATIHSALAHSGTLAGEKRQRIPFPVHARGFIRYHFPHGTTPLEGGLRFRCTTGSSPSSFSRGHDLLGTSGFPWQISLPQLACRAGYAWIAEELLQENLVTQEQLAQCQRVFGHHGSIYPHYLLFHLDPTFLLRFSSQVNLTVVGEAGGVSLFPWTGTLPTARRLAVARFERSTLPENAGRRPVAYTVGGYQGRVVRPEEGHLFTVRYHSGPPLPWAYDLDRDEIRLSALRVLWDNSRTA